MLNPADLPDDSAALKALLVASEGRNLRKQDRIDQLEKLVADFKRALFGARSEKTDPEQFELALEDIETAMAAVHAEDEALDPPTSRATKHAIRIAERCPSICPVLKRLLRLTARSAAAVPSAM